MKRIIHELVQDSDEWYEFRLAHDGASEAAAALGLSKTTPRNELLGIKHTGIAKEFSDWVQKNVLDRGHEVEKLARPIAEEIIGEELYPATYSFGRLSASCDGMTMAGDIAFEHKQYNTRLAASVERQELPDEHQPQCQQVMYVTGADKLLFMVSDGTKENCVWMWVFPDPEWVKRIISGWKQFNEDLLSYVPAEVIPAAFAAPTLDLPVVSIQTTGSIAVRSNLRAFGEALNVFIEKLPKAPSTDQEFADCKAALGKLKSAEETLDSEEIRALSQMAEIDEMRREKKLYQSLARTTRLALEKLVATRELQIKAAIVSNGRAALDAHLANLDTRLGKPYMPAMQDNFASAIKNKRTITSLQGAVDDELARCKIAANETADKIQVNLNALLELASEHTFLFADAAHIVLKDRDDFVMLVKSRIAEHKAAEDKKLEEAREKIRKEEQERADREAAAKIEAERKEQERSAKPVAAPAIAPPESAAPVLKRETVLRAVEPTVMSNILVTNVLQEIVDRITTYNRDELMIVKHCCDRIDATRHPRAA